MTCCHGPTPQSPNSKPWSEHTAYKKALRPARKRNLVDTIKAAWKVSTRRACSVLKIDRLLYVYKWKRGDQAELKLRIKDICQTRSVTATGAFMSFSSGTAGRSIRRESIVSTRRWVS